MKFKLAFALHNHQPVGNFNFVFEDAHNRCYLPFLELVKKYPAFKMSLHQSGILWDWQKEHHPEFFKLAGDLVDSGQVELLSGAFYEPILPSIPDRDKTGQINMLSTYLKEHFEYDARGMWLAERVWEPNLPGILHDCGIRYLPLDDTHFKYAGLHDRQLFGTYVTEEAGKTITLLPILKRLRYLIPFGEPQEVIDFLGQAAHDHPDGVAVYADDGEKFGIWPDTYDHCYRNRWLERFFEALDDNSDWLEVISLGRALELTKPLGRVYLPTASYAEMLHWALPTDSYVAYDEFDKKLEELRLKDDYGQFVRGGHWRGFLTKYDEVNLMHKKMLAVSDLLDKVQQESVDSDELAQARDLLYAGQCNCPYWHGVFGGLYLPHLRWAIYRKLIKAEQKLREISGKEIYADFYDLTRDGTTEIILGGKNLAMIVCPGKGGQILELDIIDRDCNITDCLSRRREGYHQKLLNLKKQQDAAAKSIHDKVVAKEEGLEKILIEDWYLKRSLTDHFFDSDTTVEKFASNKYFELGDFIIEPFDSSFVENEDNFQVALTRRGHVWNGDFHCPVKLEKIITFPKVGHNVTIEYHILQNDLEIMPVNFGVEFNFNLLAPDAEDRYALIDGFKPDKPQLAATGDDHQVSEIAYHDEYLDLGIRIVSDQAGKVWRSPLYTVSLSEGGFEKVFQGNSTVFVFEKSLASGKELNIKFELTAGPRAIIMNSSKHKDVAVN